LPNLYRRAALFVAPFVRTASGDQEGLPVALMEAIACGCPSLAGELSVMADIFSADDADFLVNPTDIPRLAAKILALLADTPVAVARTLAIRRRLSVRLNWDAIASEYVQCLTSIATSLP
jgi:glycosyltransferase involved in cell wall biosynthesis